MESIAQLYRQLNENYSTKHPTNNLGQKFHPAHIDNFYNWFGESKVREPMTGRPLVVYHGSPDKRWVSQDGTFKTTKERYGHEDPERRFYFSSDHHVAKTYANPRRAWDYQNAEEGVVPVYLKLEKPMTIDAKGGHWRDTDDMIDEAKKAGHDGVIIHNVRDEYNVMQGEHTGRKSTVYVAFHPHQIKATNNTGSFKTDSHHIMEDNPEYQGEHQPPGKEEGAPLHDLTGGGMVYPEDVYTHSHHYYDGGDHEAMDRESFGIAQGARNRPNREVKIYRAVPHEESEVEELGRIHKEMGKYLARRIVPDGGMTGFKNESEWYDKAHARRTELLAKQDAGTIKGPERKKINPGDWVTINRDYAKEHGHANLQGKFKILSKTVKAKEIFTNGDSIHEWGYWPEKSSLKEGIYYHPKLDDEGKLITIHEPHTPTDEDTWKDKDYHALITPAGRMPEKLNKIPFKSWEPKHKDWNKVEGQGDFEEPLMENKTGKKLASGLIMHEPDGRVWLVHPTNQFGGYEATFPKGKLDSGLNPRANAIKETWEESGLQAEITGHAMDVERTTSMTRYYHAKRVGGHPADMGWESQAVSLVPKHRLEHVLSAPADQPLVKHLTGQ